MSGDSSGSGNHLRHVGYCALVGRPNTGKSTLLNRILGQKISITTHKPQTTRHQILGIKTDPVSQVIYVDTPGIHRHDGSAINRVLNKAASSVFQDVDVVVMLVDGAKWGEEEEMIVKRLQHVSCPVILAINKVDLIPDKTRLLPLMAEYHDKFQFRELIPVSARRGQHVQQLEAAVTALLPEGGALFPDDQVTDRSERFLCAEIVREKLMLQLGQELPYSLTVEIEQFKEGETLDEITALIWVNRASHKSIVIGKGGERLKAVGSSARKDLEHFLGKKVFLQLWVKVRQGWVDDDRALKRFGYGDHV